MFNDWSEYKKSVFIDKKVEKCKQTIQTCQNNKVTKGIAKQQINKIQPIQRFINNNIEFNNVNCVDKSTLKKLNRGSYTVDMAIDLHGYSLNEAYNLFYRGLSFAILNSQRLVLVITGIGNGNDQSIRMQFIHWLNVPEISSHILHVRHAHLKHGGKGAFYLVLRKNNVI